MGESNSEDVNEELNPFLYRGKMKAKDVLGKIKNKKMVGPDSILIIVWKCIDNIDFIWLTKFLSKILGFKRMSNAWKKSIVIPIHMSVKLMSHRMKLWENVVEKCIRHVLSDKDNQFGYITQRSITKVIFLSK